ncbi:MAG: helicase-related protein [Alphaproteobacteria bacterium]
MTFQPHDSRITAVLGPTNTGKTHLAVERMLAHSSGMIGLPLRLLAREIYDRVVARVGPKAAALITGEERIIPEGARYFIATAEAMPMDQRVDFMAVDEIQMMRDRERGHVFTDRVLNARGTSETMLLGASTARPLIRALVPKAEIEERPRFSTLTHIGHHKLTRLPRRSAVVGFTAAQVYEMAELIRRQRGGAAVVMGALSPRTRNAQVELFQSGDVDFLVATDAIGMGLNLAVDHVAFAASGKFDGIGFRNLEPAEMGQIAGRAGRFRTDGTFGTTGDAQPFEPQMVERLEDHRFKPLQIAQWRNSDLNFGSFDGLLASLAERPDVEDEVLRRAREALDERVLIALGADRAVRDRVRNRAGLRLLWDVCQVPDFRQVMEDQHLRLLKRLFLALTEPAGTVPDEWIGKAVAPLDNVNGDIDILSTRIAHIRTWTYIAHRPGWLRDPLHWQERTRAIEDRLSDALHDGLTSRFVDRRTSVLLKRMKSKDSLMTAVNASGEVTLEGEFAGQITGLKFVADEKTVGDVESRTLMEAAREPVARELQARATRLVMLFDAADKADRLLARNADGDDAAAAVPAKKAGPFDVKRPPKAPVAIDESGAIDWEGVTIARALKGGGMLRPQVQLDVDPLLDATLAERLRVRIEQWLHEYIDAVLAPIVALNDDTMTDGAARALAFQLYEGLGVLPRDGEVAELVRAMDQDVRRSLRERGVRFGELTLFQPAMLKPRPVTLKRLLWRLWHGLDALADAPGAGLCSVPSEKNMPDGFYELCGFRQTGRRAVRIDMLERLSDMLRPLNSQGPFEITSDHMSIVGCSGEDFTSIMLALGYRSREADPDNLPENAILAPKPEQPAPADAPADQAAAEATQTEAPAAEATVTETSAAEKPAEEKSAEEKPAEEAAVEDAPAEVEETPKVMLWRLKRGARQVGGAPKARESFRGGAGGADRASHKAGKSQKRGRDQTRDDKKRGDKKRAPQKHSARPPKRERAADPDSPFAALGALKDKLKT